MQGPTLAEYVPRAGIERYPAFAPFVQLDKKPFKSKVQKPSLCVHNQWYRLPEGPGSWKSIPAVGAALHYIRMNEATSGGGEHTQLNLMQKVFTLDDELAMARKSMTGAV